MIKIKRNQLPSRKPNQQRNNNPAHLPLRMIRRKLQKSQSQLRNNRKYPKILILVKRKINPKLHLMRVLLMNLVARKNHPSQKKKVMTAQKKNTLLNQL